MFHVFQVFLIERHCISLGCCRFSWWSQSVFIGVLWRLLQQYLILLFGWTCNSNNEFLVQKGWQDRLQDDDTGENMRLTLIISQWIMTNIEDVLLKIPHDILWFSIHDLVSNPICLQISFRNWIMGTTYIVIMISPIQNIERRRFLLFWIFKSISHQEAVVVNIWTWRNRRQIILCCFRFRQTASFEDVRDDKWFLLTQRQGLAHNLCNLCIIPPMYQTCVNQKSTFNVK